MEMNPNKLVKALRRCANGESEDCPFAGYGVCGCPEMSADQIERDQKEIAELREENERLTAENAKAEAERDALTEQIKERHDCMNCKHNDFCDFDSYTVLDCMNCVQEWCPCAGCFDSSRWEWRGLPEAPEEGEKEDA